MLILAVFWLAIGIFLLRAPDDVFRSPNPRLRRIGATVAFVFATASLVIFVLG